MSTQGTNKPDGNFARRALGSAVNTVLDYFQHSEAVTVASGGGVETILGGQEILSLLVVYDTSNDTLALYEVRGTTGDTSLLASGAGAYSAAAATASSINVFYNTDHYEVENTLGGDVNLELFAVRVP
jgi:hypothetical protein